MRNSQWILAGSALALLASGARLEAQCVQPGLLYANDCSGVMWSIDTDTLTATRIGSLTPSRYLPDIAITPDGRMFGGVTSEFVSGPPASVQGGVWQINSCTAAMRLMSTSPNLQGAIHVGLAGALAGETVYLGGPPLSTIDANDPFFPALNLVPGGAWPPMWGDLAFEPSTGRLVGDVRDDAGCGTGGAQLIEIDPTTGSQIGPSLGCIRDDAGNPFAHVWGLAFDCQGRLWGTRGGIADSSLLLIDSLTAVAKVVPIAGGFSCGHGLASLACPKAAATPCADRSGPSYLPFFREDRSGANSPGAHIALTNNGDDPVIATIEFFAPNGLPIPIVDPAYQTVVLPARNTVLYPSGPANHLLRLRDILGVNPGNPDQTAPYLGHVIITPDLGSARIDARLYMTSVGEDIENPSGFTEASQTERSHSLYEDLYLNVRAGGSANFHNREFIVLANADASPVSFHIEFFNLDGSLEGRYPPTSSDSVPARGMFFYNTAARSITHDPLLNRDLVYGNAVITVDDPDPERKLHGISVVFGSNSEPDDREPFDQPREGQPIFASDLRPKAECAPPASPCDLPSKGWGDSVDLDSPFYEVGGTAQVTGRLWNFTPSQAWMDYVYNCFNYDIDVYDQAGNQVRHQSGFTTCGAAVTQFPVPPHREATASVPLTRNVAGSGNLPAGWYSVEFSYRAVGPQELNDGFCGQGRKSKAVIPLQILGVTCP